MINSLRPQELRYTLSGTIFVLYSLSLWLVQRALCSFNARMPKDVRFACLMRPTHAQENVIRLASQKL